MERSLVSRDYPAASSGTRLRARTDTDVIRLRHTDEWVGLLVVAAALVFLGAVLEAGVLRD